MSISSIMEPAIKIEGNQNLVDTGNLHFMSGAPN